MTSSKKIIIIDSHALIHRSYHALPPLTTKKGQIVNAVYGFTSVLLKVIKEIKPDYILAAFDLEAKTFRHRAYTEYKAQRAKADDELYVQIPIVKQVLGVFNIPYFEMEGYEADDIIGTMVEKITKSFSVNGENKMETIIVTGDLDTLQLVNPITKIYTLKKGIGDIAVYDEKAVFDRYQLNPEQMNDFKGLKGDPSDNIPGVPGIGEKTAIQLVKIFGSIEALYKELEKISISDKDSKNTIAIKGVKLSKKILTNLTSFKDQAFFSRELATIRRDVPLVLDWQKLKYIKDFDKDKTVELFKELEFYSLTGRLDHLFDNNNLGDFQKNEAENVDKKDRYGELISQADKFYKEGLFSKKVYDIEKELAPVIANMEKAGIKINVGHLEDLSKSLSIEIGKLAKRIYEQVGEEFNINSPAQLSKILFEKLKISFKGLRKTPKGGIISTNVRELIKLKNVHPAIEAILKYRELNKLKSTYTDSLVQAVNSQTGRIHTKFNPLGAVTGRISSSEPNLQNIPIRTSLGNEIRKAFVAPNDWVLIAGDYSQLELRIMAALAGDSKMNQAFKQGQDIHSLTASEINKVPLDKVTPQMRSLAKAINFGIIYGMGVNGLAEGAGISKDEAREFIDKYRADFPQITGYIETLKQLTYQNGYALTLYGRKRFLPELKSKSFILRRAAERMAVNMPIQGTAADIVKEAMIQVNKNISQAQARLLLQVHDELVLEVKKEYQEEISKKLKQIMEGAGVLRIPLKVDISIGKNWGEMKKIYR